MGDQYSAARILRAIDDRIELSRRICETMETMARILFESWFVDFEPVRAKKDRNWNANLSLAGVPSYLYDLFPDQLVRENADVLPEGWKTQRLSHFFRLSSESWSKKNHPESVKYLDLSSVKNGEIRSTSHYEWSAAPSRARRILRPGDTIVGTVRPENGSYALITERDLTASTGFAVLRPLQSTLREFVYLASTSTPNVERLARQADGAAYPAIRPGIVGEMRIAVPPLDHPIFFHFSKIARTILDPIRQTNSHTLVTVRKHLLGGLFVGASEVPAQTAT